MHNKEETYRRINLHYREEKNKLVSFYNKFFHNMDRTEDVVQEAYTRALTYWEGVPEGDEFYPWFQTILSNCVRDNWKTELGQGMSWSAEAEEVPVKAAAIPTIIFKQVEQRIEAEPENVAKILHLFFLQQYNAKEVSEMVPETANAIRVIVHRFRNKIREEFRWVI